ncbi:bone morphogenetic protein 3 [Bombina bombina]|uniref:bone morphogenetic protein 3 n=1 Tax=Bombina bombina TaxID=8345 RepID=UPI00235AA454|nr:bone morphogenetic protein 3 [Bombina bombina]
MIGFTHWLLLWVGCNSCLCLGLQELLKDGMVGMRSAGYGVQFGAGGEAVLPPGDTVSEHMLRLYDKYRGGRVRETSSRHQLPLQDGNTVRSFRAISGDIHNRSLHIFNMTSLTKSENILSATLHYYLGDLVNSTQRCPHSLSCPRRGRRKFDFTLNLTVWSFSSLENHTQILGNFLINISTSYRDFPSWQWKDITQVLREAKQNGDTLIGINMTVAAPNQRRKQPLSLKPYILVFANDSAISEPDSVVSNLHGQRKPLTHKPHRKAEVVANRRRRSTDILLPLQNNELPGAEYQYNEDNEGWVDKKSYKTLQVQPSDKENSKKKLKKSGRQKSQTLQFDEQTLKKARRKQWNEPRNCARRYLKVDFADIGWSEWIISPKSFDAYYCSGACQFPMPKSLKPSNHATIQSIVRAVGVVPGIPEPCCVPEKMSSLSILFFDENKNVVLKVYPNMTVNSCACR